MQKVIHFVRKYPFSLLCLALIGILSFIPFFPETPLDNVDFIDKWTHLAMYGGTSAVIWWEYMRSHQHLDMRKLLLWAFLAMILIGGLVEVVQEWCTTTRSGEWFDFAADSTGVLLGNATGWLMNLCYFHRL